MIRNGVATGTNKNYGRSFERWKAFSTKRNVSDAYMSDLPEKQKVVLLCLFMAKTGREGRDVQAEMSGVRHAFQTAIVDTSIFHHAGVVAAKKSLAPDQREESLRRERRQRVPLPFEVVEAVRREYWLGAESRSDPMLARMTYLGIAIGYATASRVSEYAHTSGNHFLRAEDIYFQVGGRMYTACQLWETCGQDVQVDVIKILTRSSKNGPKTTHLTRTANVLVAQLVDDLAMWCQLRKCSEGSMLLSRVKDGRTKRLTSKLVNEALKEQGVELGLEEARVSSHGLRMGASTSMKAAGHTVAEVRVCTGHVSSSSTTRYMAASSHDPNPLGVAARGEGLTVQDAICLLPRGDVVENVQYKRIRKV